MTKTILALLAAGSIAFGASLTILSPRIAFSMAAPVETYSPPPVHKQPTKPHMDHRQPSAPQEPQARPMERSAPPVVREEPRSPQAAPTPPQASLETLPVPPQPSHVEELIKWFFRSLGGLAVGAALIILVNAGREAYAGYKAKKAQKGTPA